MKTSPIFFERHVDFSNKQLIKASELRRKIAQGVQHNENMYSKAEEYYKLLSKIAVPTTSLKNKIYSNFLIKMRDLGRDTRFITYRKWSIRITPISVCNR